MTITWEIEDGYAGKSRPHTLEIDDEELQDYDTPKEKKEFIEECVKQAFAEEISWYISDWGDLG